MNYPNYNTESRKNKISSICYCNLSINSSKDIYFFLKTYVFCLKLNVSFFCITYSL